jgi:hypothetical protein
MRTARCLGRFPPNTRAMLTSERLPQTRQVSWGLSLTTSHSAHKTAFCSATGLRHGAPSIYELFITAPHSKFNFNSILPTYHIRASAFGDMPAFQFDHCIYLRLHPALSCSEDFPHGRFSKSSWALQYEETLTVTEGRGDFLKGFQLPIIRCHR